MRTSSRLRILFAAPLVLAAVSSASADVIYLKNGRKIVARSTREDSKEVYYEVDGGELGIPKGLVEKVEKSASPETMARGRLSPSDLPMSAQPETEPVAAESPKVIKDGAVDEAELVRLEDAVGRDPTTGNRHRLAEGYHQAAIYWTQRGEPEKAIEHYRRGLELAPDDLSLTLGLAYQLIRQEHNREAIEVLISAETQFPKTPDIPMLLGSAYYSIEELDRAIEEWRKALAFGDNRRLRQALEQAEKEHELAGDYLEMRSQHFALRFEGQGSAELARQSLATLEGAFVELEQDLDVYPQETIVVLLYPDQTFRDITRSPSWSGALNDGKIRVPVSGLSSMTYELARTLKHELTHSFVRQVMLGRSPVWFNEGLAELEEGATTASLGTALARNYADLPSFLSLEKPFTGLAPTAVPLAYAKSLAALEYLRDTGGRVEIQRFLKLMANEPQIEGLLQTELRMGYAEFDQAVGAYLARRYGM
jgi:tetratricopeptide (TPR) repeat protein